MGCVSLLFFFSFIFLFFSPFFTFFTTTSGARLEVAWKQQRPPEHSQAVRDVDKMPKPQWFRELYGFEEGSSYTTNRSKFRVEVDDVTGERFLLCEGAPSHGQRQFLGDFSTPSLKELRAELASEGAGDVEDRRGLTFQHLCTPVGVEGLIMDPANEGSVFQAASQFNCLEMTGPGVSPAQGISIYFNDPTQGPKCALSCPAGTVYRNYLCHEDGTGQGKRQIDCLEDMGRVLGNVKGGNKTQRCYWNMQNGCESPLPYPNFFDAKYVSNCLNFTIC